MLCGLHVLHRRKEGSPVVALPRLPRGTNPNLVLDTCQRWICVLQSPEPFDCPPDLDHFSGEEAYHFLLRVTTGLESRLQGETNIFGQVKHAWAPHGTSLPWLQRLFEDTKEIRARHLAEVGGPSYGRLVRRLLQPVTHPSRIPTVLLVGAGELAQAVAPWLSHVHLRILNRDVSKAENLAASLRAHPRPGCRIDVVAPSKSAEAWRQAEAVVVCIPYDPAADFERIAWLEEFRHSSRAPIVIHLGGEPPHASAWQVLQRFYSIDDVFRLHEEESDPRRNHLRRADRACRERSRLRSLGPSLAIFHGWEDLAAFSDWETTDAATPDIHGRSSYHLAVA